MPSRLLTLDARCVVARRASGRGLGPDFGLDVFGVWLVVVSSLWVMGGGVGFDFGELSKMKKDVCGWEDC